MSKQRNYSKREWQFAGVVLLMLVGFVVYEATPPLNSTSEYKFKRSATEQEGSCINKAWSVLQYPKSIWVMDSEVRDYKDGGKEVVINFASKKGSIFYKTDRAKCIFDNTNVVTDIELESRKLSPEERIRQARAICRSETRLLAKYPDTVKFINIYASEGVEDENKVNVYMDFSAKNKLSLDVRYKSRCEVEGRKITSYYLDGKKVPTTR